MVWISYFISAMNDGIGRILKSLANNAKRDVGCVGAAVNSLL